MRDFTKYTDAELEEALTVIKANLAGIRSQVEEAKSEAATKGKYSDPEWFNRARGALRSKGAEHQAILRERARRRKESVATRVSSFENTFLLLARARLSPSTFDLLWKETERATGIYREPPQ